MPTPTPFPPADWRAKDFKELRSIWEALRPDLDAADTERKFRGEVLTAKQAGDVFERWVLEAFRLSGTTGLYPYVVPGGPDGGGIREQIDGLVFDGWQGFVVESKFWTEKVDFGPIALLAHRVDLRPVGTLGLFFSGFGYTTPALDAANLIRPLRVLLFDGLDLNWAVHGKARSFQGRMAEMVRIKWRLAVKLALPNVSLDEPLTLFP
jgi:hypothetical protein